MRIAREEIFGPVVCLIRYETEDEAVALANASEFGLSGAVFTADTERGTEVARRVRTGTITVNGFRLDLAAPSAATRTPGSAVSSVRRGCPPTSSTRPSTCPPPFRSDPVPPYYRGVPTMRAAFLHTTGDETLDVRDVESVSFGPGRVRVKMHKAACATPTCRR